ncbi:MAG: hypothetical protein L3J46_11340 [Kangiellaceae bacterium]|nr:hypothetical protein [Kangiellaceae bacterium]
MPIAYKKASFRFNQKILLLEAINGRKIDTWVYSSLKVFNSLRNSYAHVLEPLNSKQKIKDFLNIAYVKDQELESKANRHLDTLAKNKADILVIELQNAHYDSSERLPRAIKKLLNRLIAEL